MLLVLDERGVSLKMSVTDVEWCADGVWIRGLVERQTSGCRSEHVLQELFCIPAEKEEP